MRIRSLISIASLLFLIACNKAKRPTPENFTEAINQYLSRHGVTCTSIGREFPIDIPASVQPSGYGFGPQLVALQHAGLVSEKGAIAVIHGMLDAVRGSTPPQAVRRYQLTTEGAKYFQQVSSTLGRTGGFCYGQKTVDSVLKWTDPVSIGATSQTEVTYTYKIVNLPAWAELSEIQESFPDIKGTVDGASKSNQMLDLQLATDGWQAVTP